MTVAEQHVAHRPRRVTIAAERDRHPSETVRLRRLVIDQPGLQIATDVHPTLTVIVVPAGQVERTTWLVQDCLFDSESGVHAELRDGQGRNLLLFRPHGGRRRAIDLDTQVEALPPRFADPDLAEPLGAPPEFAALNCTDDLSMSAAQAITALSAAEQGDLWRAAEQLVAARASGHGSCADPTAADDPGPLARRPIGEVRRLRRGNLVHRSHRAPLVGAVPMATDVAESDWRAVAGDVPVELACALRSAIEVCAGARSRTVALAAVSSAPLCSNAGDADGDADSSASEPVGGPAVLKVVAEGLAAVLGDSSHYPQALVLPPPGADPAGLQLLLDVLPDLLTDRQVIAITSDADVADWAGLEEHAGQALTVRARAR